VPPNFAEMFADALDAIGSALIVKLALACPARTVTVAGTVAADGLSLERLTTMPPVGAGPVRLTVPRSELPPTIVVGLRLRDIRLGGSTVSSAACEVPYVAVMCAALEAATPFVVTVNVPINAPAVSVTVAGTVATVVLSLDKLTVAPPTGAGPNNVTVPCTVNPPTVLIGANKRELRPGVVCRTAV
jgi:hypothetical protein